MIEKFTLGGIDWSVKVDNQKLDDKGFYGACNYHTSEILIQKQTDGNERTDSAIEQTLYHEVVHAILDTLNKDDLSKDEDFVQQFSLLLHQFEKTKK